LFTTSTATNKATALMAQRKINLIILSFLSVSELILSQQLFHITMLAKIYT
jgi:hypothetical protein